MSTFTLTLRSSSPTALTNTQMDDNFLFLQELANLAITTANSNTTGLGVLTGVVNSQGTTLSALGITVSTQGTTLTIQGSTVSTHTTQIATLTTGLAAANANLPVGTLVSFLTLHTPSLPTNWVKCDGAAVSRTTYAALFALLSTDYGAGNGTTTFNLPLITTFDSQIKVYIKYQ